MKIIVLDGATLNPGDNSWESLTQLGEVTLYDRTLPEERMERIKDAEIVVTNKVQFSREVIEELPKLKMIAVTATGYNIVDVAAAKEKGIVVSNVPEYSTDSVAQFTFALILEFAHKIGHHDAAVHAGRWSESRDFCFWDTPQMELVGKTLGVIGYGRIGKRVGEIAKVFGMRVITAGRDKNEVTRLLAESDVITLHCPLTPENTGMVNTEFMSHMKSSAFLVNTSRGGLINEKDLAEALNTGKIAGAGVDVVSVEPIKADNPLLTAKNCIITPHMAWASLEARKRLMATVVENVRNFIKGSPSNLV